MTILALYEIINIHEQKVGNVLAELDDDGFYNVSKVRRCSDWAIYNSQICFALTGVAYPDYCTSSIKANPRDHIDLCISLMKWLKWMIIPASISTKCWKLCHIKKGCLLIFFWYWPQYVRHICKTNCTLRPLHGKHKMKSITPIQYLAYPKNFWNETNMVCMTSSVYLPIFPICE